ncbi:MAG: hypothetical protein WBO38_17610 [Chitinophagaceae bacterium]
MKKLILSTIAAGFMLLAFSATASAQKKINVKVESKAVDANRGSNPKIKSEAPTTDVVEAKSRSTCSVYFDNYSGLYVKVYVDGYYRGTLSPYGSFTVNVADGYTEIYCISTGGTRDWSASGNCTGRYIYSLY